jgi:hypothetical protein
VGNPFFCLDESLELSKIGFRVFGLRMGKLVPSWDLEYLTRTLFARGESRFCLDESLELSKALSLA